MKITPIDIGITILILEYNTNKPVPSRLHVFCPCFLTEH
jgi:hypothetical protein